VAALAARLCHAEDLPLVLQIAVPMQPSERDEGGDALVAGAAQLGAGADADLLLLPLAGVGHAASPWACVLEAAAPDALHVELDLACAFGARGFAASLKPPGGPLDEATLLDRAAPLAAALRARVEEALLAA